MYADWRGKAQKCLDHHKNFVHLPKAAAYGKFSEFQNCVCGLDPGNLKSETVRTDKRHVCF